MSDLSPEKRQELIEKMAKFIVDNEIVEITELVVETSMPFGYIVGRLGYVATFPWIYALFGDRGGSYVNAIGLDFSEVMPKVIKRAHELKAETERIKVAEKAEKPKSLFRKLADYLFPSTFIRWLQGKYAKQRR